LSEKPGKKSHILGVSGYKRARMSFKMTCIGQNMLSKAQKSDFHPVSSKSVTPLVKEETHYLW